MIAKSPLKFTDGISIHLEDRPRKEKPIILKPGTIKVTR